MEGTDLRITNSLTLDATCPGLQLRRLKSKLLKLLLRARSRKGLRLDRVTKHPFGLPLNHPRWRWYAANQIPSKMTQKELGELYKQYGVLSNIRFVALKLDDVLSRPFSGHITIHKDCLKNDLHFPFHPFMCQEFLGFGICPTQLIHIPNMWMSLVATWVLYCL